MSLREMSAGRTSRFTLAYTNWHLGKITSFMALVFIGAKSFVLTKVYYGHICAMDTISMELHTRFCK